MHAHRANTKKRETLAYTGPVAHPTNPEAHGGTCVVDHCSCGATRRTNRNGRAREIGEWVEPKNYRQGAVWDDSDYQAKGYPPRLGTVRFRSHEAMRALEQLSRQRGISRSAVLEELVLSAAGKQST